MNVNIKRARLIEFDWPDYQGQPTTPRITAMRNARGDAFDFLAIDGVVVGDEYSDCICEGDLAARAKNIVVFAEFPLSLADLIPGDCQAFRFKNNGLTDTAVFDMVYKTWEVTGHDGDFATLDSLAEHFDIELDTVVPLALTTHSDYVESRR